MGISYGALQWQTTDHRERIAAMEADARHTREQHNGKVSEILVELERAAGERALILDRIERGWSREEER